jgi:hypothetical protein
MVNNKIHGQGLQREEDSSGKKRSGSNEDPRAPARSIEEAMNHPAYGRQWEQAFLDEHRSLKKNHTGDLVKKTCEGRKIVTCKWDFRYKRNQLESLVLS